MITLTKDEYDDQWIEVIDIFRRNANEFSLEFDMGGVRKEDFLEMYYYLWVIARWKQDKFQGRQYNNYTTPVGIGKVIARMNQLKVIY